MKDVIRFLDLCVIDEYATKDFRDGWSLDADNIPRCDIETLVNLLMQEDTAVRDTIMSHIQTLIDERIRDREVNERYAAGFRAVRHADGDLTIERRAYQ